MVLKLTDDPKRSPRTKLLPGFTIVEVIVTVLIISIGCLAALMMQSSSIKGNNLADSQTVATFLAESEMERLRSMTFEELTNEINKGATVTKHLNRTSASCTPSVPDSCADFNYKMTTYYYAKQPTNYSHQAEIQVSWRDTSGTHEVFYSTIFTDLEY
jgi:type IV pilus modification protein PilV